MLLVPALSLALDLRGDLAALLGQLPGEYDNYAQWEGDVETGAAAAVAHPHTHSIFFGPIALPDLGSHVYYEQQYRDGVPTNVSRQRLYSWSVNATAGALVLAFFEFRDPARFVDAHLRRGALEAVTPEDVRRLPPGCDVLVRRGAGGVFRGASRGACVVPGRTGRPVRVTDAREFGSGYVAFHERGVDARTGAAVFGRPTPDLLNRTRAARRFAGWVAVEPQPHQWGLMSSVLLWDGGQLVPVVLDGGKATNFTLELAYCTYPNGDHVLKIAVHEAGFTHDGLRLPPAYAWTDPEAEQIGINLRSIQAGFRLVKAEPSPEPAVLV